MATSGAGTTDSGVDAYFGGAWMGSLSGFVRRERDVIDWVRPDATQRWRSENIRAVRSHGVEASVRG